MRVSQLLAVLVALSLVVGSLPAVAMASTASTSTPQLNQVQDDTNTTNQSERTRASTGQQLSTVLAVTDDEVTTAIDESSAEAAFESAAETERATLLASRASTLRDRADELVDERREATAAYEDGTLSDSEYAQRVAVLSGQASTVSVAFDRLDQRAESVPAADLAAAGYDAEANAEAQRQLRSLTGSSARALLAQYTGLASGEFSIDRADGVSIEVESDDGERTRGFERDQPGDGSFAISQREAVTTAEDALAAEYDGEWTLRSAERDSSGYFELEFSFFGPTHTGEAEVSVDGQTGEIFEFEEELEPRDRDEDDEDETPLSITVVSGEPAPGATVTLQVTAAGEPVAGAEVEIDDQVVGTTDENGQLTVTLPDDDEVDIEAESGEREGELELSLGAEREDDDDESDEADESDELSVSVVSGDPAPNATVTIEVTQNGNPVADASVTVNDERVGQTDENGQLMITLPDDEDVEIDVEFGDSEGELEFEFEADDDETDDDEADDDEADDDDDDDEDNDEDDDEDTDEDDDDDEADN